VPAITAFSKVRSAIAQAINLDPGSAVAHAVFSEALLFGDWDWSGARGASDHALRLDPGSTFVRQNAVRLYIGLGEYATAQTEAQHALMLDPSCAQLHVLFAQAMIHAGDYERVIPFLSDLIELEPECRVARRFRAQAYLWGGHPEKAICDLEHLLQEADTNSTEIAMLSRAFAECGDADRAREMHAKLLEMSSTEHIVRVNLALSAIGLGEEREAMQHLESAYLDREPILVFLKGLHWFEPLRHMPEFAQMLVNIGPKSRRDRSTNASYGIDGVEEMLA
jgi:predicted Zn-dependent protease